MKKSLAILSFILLAAVAVNANAFDETIVKKIDTVTSKLTQTKLAKGGCKISAEDTLKLLTQKKQKVVVLDIRTEAEAKVVAMPQALHIPMDQLFKKANLKRLPTDARILVVCHSGNRAAAATALLRSAGFSNAVFVKGGLIDLTTATTPGTVPVE